MKKIFSILAIAALVSCNNGGEASEVKPVDSPAVAPATDATVTPATDTTTVKADTTTAK